MSAEKYGPQSYFTSNGIGQPAAPFNRPNAKSMFPTAPQVPKKPNSEQMGYSQPNPPNNPIDDNPPLYENVSQPHQANPFPQQLGVMTPLPQYLAQSGSPQQQQQSNVIILGGQSTTPIKTQPAESKIEFGFVMKCACMTIFICGLLPGVIACILALFGRKSAVEGEEDKARRLYRASLLVSVVGWIVGTILFIAGIIVVVEKYGKHSSGSSSYNPYYYTYYYY